MSSVFDVTVYGAVPATSGDSRAAINLAIAALNAHGGGELYFPETVYAVSGALDPITTPGCARGDNLWASQILTYSSTDDIFAVTGAHPFLFEDLSIGAYSSVNNTGNGIRFDPPSDIMWQPQLNRVALSWFKNGAFFGSVGQASISNCVFSNNLNQLYINNEANPDLGFGSISSSQFSGGGRAGVTGIRQINNGGISIEDGCFFFQEDYHYLLALNTYRGEDGQYNTSDLIIQGCFFDAWGKAAVSLQGPAASNQGFTNFIIGGNTFSALAFSGYAGGNALEVLGGGPGWLQEGTIGGNNFQFAEQVQTYSSLPAGVSLANCDNILVGENSYYGVGAMTCTGVYVDHSCGSGVKVNPNSRFRILSGVPITDLR